MLGQRSSSCGEYELGRDEMAVIRVETEMEVPPALCFDLGRSIELHVASTGDSDERAIAGVTSGLIGKEKR